MSGKYATSKLAKLVLALVVCAVLVFSNPRGFFDPLRGFLLTLTLPFQRLAYQSTRWTGETFSFLSSIGDIKKDNEDLSRENNSLAAEVARLKEVEAENADLRRQLDLAPRDKFSLIGGFVVGQDSQGSESWFLFDHGAHSGIVLGMAVIVDNGIIVGRVSEVYPTSAKVQLLTDSNSSVNVTDVETGAKGIARGVYGLGLVMDMVTQSDQLNPGDTVVTSGLGGTVPNGLLVGRIKDIKVSPDRLFQVATIIPRTKYSALDVVFAVK